MSVWLIIGASRGIGLELARQLALATSPPNTVIATYRVPSAATSLLELAAQHRNMHIVSLDDRSDESVQAAVAATSAIVRPRGVDILINSADLQDKTSVMPEDAEASFLRIFLAFLPLIRAGRRKLVVSVSNDATANRTTGTPNMLASQLATQYPDLVIRTFAPSWISEDALSAIGSGAQLPADFAISRHVQPSEYASLAARAVRQIERHVANSYI